MATITLKGKTIHTSGELPSKGSTAANFNLVGGDLSDVTLESYSGKRKLLNIFPSVDTGTCAASVRNFNEKSASLDKMVVLNISADLPFAQGRFCGAENIKDSHTLSCFRSSFAKDYGLEIIDGPLKGLCSRCIILLDVDNTVLYTEQVSEIADEPNYDLALSAGN
jgi:thiol peroxidase